MIQPLQDITQDSRQVFDLWWADPAERTAVRFREHPQLERKARSKWSKGHKIIILSDHPPAVPQFLLEHIAVEAPFLRGKVVASDHKLCLDGARRYRQGHQLRD